MHFYEWINEEAFRKMIFNEFTDNPWADAQYQARGKDLMTASLLKGVIKVNAIIIRDL